MWKKRAAYNKLRLSFGFNSLGRAGQGRAGQGRARKHTSLQIHIPACNKRAAVCNKGVPANLGKGDSSRVKAAKMAAKMRGPVPCARALAPYKAP